MRKYLSYERFGAVLTGNGQTGGSEDMPMFKKSFIILLVLAVAAIGGTVYGLHSGGEAIELDSADRSAQPAEVRSQLAVYVTGAVNKPGVVMVPEGARVLDAVNAAGGVLPTADAEKVNMAQAVKDGQQVRIPERSGAGNAGSSGAPGKNGDGLININTADAKALDTLPGIGPAMAQRIIDYRESEGAFQSIEDLKKIKGIGDAKFSKLKDKICI